MPLWALLRRRLGSRSLRFRPAAAVPHCLLWLTLGALGCSPQPDPPGPASAPDTPQGAAGVVSSSGPSAGGSAAREAPPAPAPPQRQQLVAEAMELLGTADASEEVQLRALQSLEAEAAHASAAEPLILAVLQSPKTALVNRRQGLKTLATIRPRQPATLAVLSGWVETESDMTLRSYAALTIGSLDPSILEDPDRRGEVAGIIALLLDTCQGQRGAERGQGRLYEAAATALGTIARPENSSLVPHFIEWLNARSFTVRNAAKMGLKRVGAPAVPALEHLLKSDSPERRFAAVLVLAELVEDKEELASLLTPLLEDPDLKVKRQVVQSFAQLHEPARQLLPEFLELLYDPAWQIRRQAILTLMETNPDSGDFVLHLKRVRREETNKLVRATAEKALKALE